MTTSSATAANASPRWSVKARVKHLVPVAWHARARRLSRLRWFTKADVLRYSNVGVRDVRPTHLRYLLWDPEVESHTYDVANVEEMARYIAETLGADPDVVRSHLEEGAADPEFTQRWRARLGHRFDLKNRLMLANRLLWWGIVRTLKPQLCVECGTYNGAGALVLLRALERNAVDGHPGRLVSVDADPSSGWVVPERLRSLWTQHTGTTDEVLERVLEGQQVNLLIHDTPHTAENARLEFSEALSHAGAPLVLLDSAGGRTGVLQTLCREHGGTYSHFREQAANHFIVSCGTGVGLFAGVDR